MRGPGQEKAPPPPPEIRFKKRKKNDQEVGGGGGGGFFLTRTSHTTSNARSLLPSVPNYDEFLCVRSNPGDGLYFFFILPLKKLVCCPKGSNVKRTRGRSRTLIKAPFFLRMRAGPRA